MYLYNLYDQPVRPATEEEIEASANVPSGVIFVKGVEYYVDEWCEGEGVDDEWRHEMAMEAGMLHGIDAYNEAMGWDVEEQYY
jgi:hypothetical protein